MRQVEDGMRWENAVYKRFNYWFLFKKITFELLVRDFLRLCQMNSIGSRSTRTIYLVILTSKVARVMTEITVHLIMKL